MKPVHSERRRDRQGEARRLRWTLRYGIGPALLACGVLVLTPVAGHAQMNALVDQLQQLGISPSQLQQQGIEPQGTTIPSAPRVPSTTPAQVTEPTVVSPGLPPSIVSAAPVSRIEADYQRRLSGDISQFGYDVFAGGAVASQVVSGAVSENYIIGIGDQVVVTLRGQVNQGISATVDREGRLILQDLPPIPAAGRSFGDLRREIETRVRENYVSTEAFVSLGDVRAISVTLTGEIAKPGTQTLTSFSTLVDALTAAGGIKKTGSLRTVALIRQGQTKVVDIYGFLMGYSNEADLLLQDGDRISIPTVGRTVAVAGDVVRPGIFEMPPDAAGPLSVAEMLDYAGGPIRPSGNRFNLLRLDRNGQDQVQNLSGQTAVPVQTGDIIQVTLAQDLRVGSVSITGNVTVSGVRPLSSAPTLRALLSDPPILADDAYLPFGVIQTTDPNTRIRKFQPVNLAVALRGGGNIRLRDRDKLIVLSREDIRYLGSDDVQTMLAGQAPAEARSAAPDVSQNVQAQNQTLTAGLPPATQVSGSCLGLRSLAEAVRNDSTGRFRNARQTFQNIRGGPLEVNRACPQIFDDFPDLLPFVIEHVVSLEGQVRVPGSYPIIPGTSLATVLDIAGGTTVEADRRAIEVGYFSTLSSSNLAGSWRSVQSLGATTASIKLNPGDSVRVPQNPQLREEGTVTLAGEFTHPGRYVIRRGETLLQLIQRSGGYTNQAFPYGAVFTREAVRQQQQQGFERTAREIQAGLPQLIQEAQSSGSGGGNPAAALPAIQSLVQELKTIPAAGRVVIEADPTVLAARPELDFTLEAGDQLYVPKRPLFVTVSGEVLNPGTVQYDGKLTADDYVDFAGGTTQSADPGRAFVVMPNGQSQPLDLSSWSYSSVRVPPGSVIIVPRDLTPFDLYRLVRDVGSIVQNLAVSAASLVVISRRN
ncbi:SLBB domain-containing protein [Inquilinus limosus]|uniref:SLBB domain-containing protein n=1 Tax=Inquilinus limosus TaxID=171674 RepID=UPI0009DB877F|nr:SLBB domain-containing protein [Inquilinus limosus]